MNSSESYWEKKGNFGARSRWDNKKSPAESPKYYGNTIKATAVFQENKHTNSHIHKKVWCAFLGK